MEAVLEDGTHWELSRTYQDFYDFQIALLKDFPEEAARNMLREACEFVFDPVSDTVECRKVLRRCQETMRSKWREFVIDSL